MWLLFLSYLLLLPCGILAFDPTQDDDLARYFTVRGGIRERFQDKDKRLTSQPVTRKQSPEMEYHLLRPIRCGSRVLVCRAILFEQGRARDKQMDALPDWRPHL